jgi:hypothetical protein
VRRNDTCPFTGDICHAGSSGAFSLDTGLVDISIIGINTDLRYKFRRQITCSPLRMDRDKFVKYDVDSTGKVSYLYKYGVLYSQPGSCGSKGNNCTWSHSLDTELIGIDMPDYRVLSVFRPCLPLWKLGPSFRPECAARYRGTSEC